MAKYIYKEAKEGRVYLVSDRVTLGATENVNLLSLIIPNLVNVQLVVKKYIPP